MAEEGLSQAYPFGFHEIADDLHHVVDLPAGEAGIGAEEQGVVHDPVGDGKRGAV